MSANWRISPLGNGSVAVHKTSHQSIQNEADRRWMKNDEDGTPVLSQDSVRSAVFEQLTTFDVLGATERLQQPNQEQRPPVEPHMWDSLTIINPPDKYDKCWDQFKQKCIEI